jgi:hypothetical protein
MRIWTIQPDGVWTRLCSEGVAFVDENDQNYRGYVPPAYRWLQTHFARFVPSYAGGLLWWAYCRKPDLRCHRHFLQKGTWVRLELEMTEASLLQFPCWAWHQVFCQDYLALTRQEYEEWTEAVGRVLDDEDVWPPPEPWKSELEASWQRLFAPEVPDLCWDLDSPWSQTTCFEATFETLRREDVRAVTRFHGSLA